MCSTERIPERFAQGAEKAAAAIDALDDVLVAAHVNLDGDALGSMAGMGWLLQESGKNFALYAPKGVPEKLAFIKLPGQVWTRLDELPFSPKSAIYLDCSVPGRLGDTLSHKFDSWPSVNIDHHLGSDGMGSLYNYICPSAAATAQLVSYVALADGRSLTGPLGEALGLGLMTDTGGFCHGNTTADVFELCALLSRAGCDFSTLRENLQHSWTLAKLRLWGRLFAKARLALDDRVALSIITATELENFNCHPDDTEGLAEWLRRLRKAKITAIIREDAPKVCKFSLRSFGDVDVRVIAASLGGGGHKNAAGGIIYARPEKARTILLQAIAPYL